MARSISRERWSSMSSEDTGCSSDLQLGGRLLAGAVPVTAVVRVYPDDRVNFASLSSLVAVGLDQFQGLGRAAFQDSPRSTDTSVRRWRPTAAHIAI